MPSATSRTRPTSRVSSCERYCSISCWRTETISSVLNLATAQLPQFLAHVEDLGAHRAVEDKVGDAEDHAAKQVWLDALVQDRFEAEGLVQIVHQPLALVVGQGDRAADLDAETPAAQFIQHQHFLNR